MLSFFLVLLCLCAPPLLMWRAIVVQRRVRAMVRTPETSYALPDPAPWTDELKSADGLSYSRSFHVNDELLEATHQANAPSDIKNIEGRR